MVFGLHFCAMDSNFKNISHAYTLCFFSLFIFTETYCGYLGGIDSKYSSLFLEELRGKLCYF